MHVVGYSPLGSPDSSAMLNHSGRSLLSHEVVQAISAESGRSAGQVLIRWGVQRGYPVLPKSVNPVRIKENFDVFDWELTQDQMDRLSSLEPQVRLLAGGFFVKPNGPYESEAEIWGEEAKL